MSMVNSNALQYDENQYQVIQLFMKVQEACKLPKKVLEDKSKEKEETPKASLFSYLWNKVNSSSPEESSSSISSTAPPSDDKDNAVDRRGLYLYGSVGTGKTLMMDMLFETTDMEMKRRVHFHKFMLEVHDIIHKYKATLGRRKLHEEVTNDPITHAAKVISERSQLLCFDEFQVTDIADAIIMTKLFNELWKRGTILVATSNRPPKDLYLGGLNRQYFLPFIAEVQERCHVAHIKSHVDYRQLMSVRAENSYFTPVNKETTEKLYDLFICESELESPEEEVQELEIPVMMGRTLRVVARGRSCFVTFPEMCMANKGAADYSALARQMDTIYMAEIPTMSVLDHDRSRRFITFVDEIYDAEKKLKWTSSKDPVDLFTFITEEEVLARKQKGQMVGGTDHSWSDPTQSHHTPSHVSIPSSAGSEYTSALDYQNQEHGFSEYKTVIVGSLKKRLSKKSTEDKGNKGGVYASDEKYGSYSDSGNKSVTVEIDDSEDDNEDADPLAVQRKKEKKLLEGELSSVQEISFAFRRCTSRLIELSSSPKPKTMSK